jgi:outer membrane lipoprotein-sorting protein
MMLAAGAAFMTSGCVVSKKRIVPPAQMRPALEAVADQLIERYNQQARAVRSLNAGAELSPVAGSSYSGVIEEYHDVRGFILATKPAHIRMIGQAPVTAKNVFDMVSDGETFRIFIPPKNKFIVGRVGLERSSKKPIENLRPQHLLEALFWPELDAGQPVLLEEFNAEPARYYVLTLLRGSAPLEIARKVWFDRTDLSLARVQLYAPGGLLVYDIRYADWQPAPADSAGAVATTGWGPGQAEVRYPRHIWLARPHDDYQLEVRITRLVLNEDIAADRFRLEQPPGTELIRVGEGDAGARP